MERRELLKMIALATGGVVIGGEFLLSGCSNPAATASMTFSDDDIKFSVSSLSSVVSLAFIGHLIVF